MERYELAARIVKARGLEGKAVVRSAGDLPFCLYEGLACRVVPPTLYGPRELVVEEVAELSADTFAVSFEELDSIDAVEELSGRYLLARADELELDYEEGLPNITVIGRSVVDERYGELGTVEELIETAANDVWVVRGVRGEVLVPAVDEFVLDLPASRDEPVRTRIPDGLVDA